MQHPFAELRPEYEKLLASMVVTRPQTVAAVTDKLLTFVRQGRYAKVSTETGVPQAWMATSFEREASSNFSLSPAQGDHWNRVSVHVPKGRGPFPDWASAAKDAYHIDGLDKIGAANWTLPLACYEGELFNGFGPRNHGRHTGYLWAGTSVYTGGKYVADGVWDPNTQDQQLGIVPVMLRMMELEPSLRLPGFVSKTFPASVSPSPGPSIVPVGVGGGAHDARWIQNALNLVGRLNPPIDMDNSYGRETKRAVIAFQTAHGLEPDGLCGPKTFAALEQALATIH